MESPADEFAGPGFSTLRALLAAVPDDPAAAFILADYLEEQGDEHLGRRGELLRLVYTLTRSPGGEHRPRLERRMRDLLGQGVRAIGPYRRLTLGDGAMTFAWIPPGTFLMGSPPDEEGHVPHGSPGMYEGGPRSLPGEGPQHEVRLTRGFWMGVTPVTQAQYEEVMARNPSWGTGLTYEADGTAWIDKDADEKPVQEVTWLDANAFLRRLRRRGGGKKGRYRLPTEAEWEYACRAGTTSRFWSGDAEADLARVGWYHGNGGSGMHPVGGKAANPLGLFDMHGNVWEWCADLYGEHYYARSPKTDPVCTDGEFGQRVVRGGDAWDDASACRSAARDSNDRECSHNDISFRVVADRL